MAIKEGKFTKSIKLRKHGDIAVCYCSPEKAKQELVLVAEYGLEYMCRYAWNWQKKNPEGFNSN